MASSEWRKDKCSCYNKFPCLKHGKTPCSENWDNVWQGNKNSILRRKTLCERKAGKEEVIVEKEILVRFSDGEAAYSRKNYLCPKCHSVLAYISFAPETKPGISSVMKSGKLPRFCPYCGQGLLVKDGEDLEREEVPKDIVHVRKEKCYIKEAK